MTWQDVATEAVMKHEAQQDADELAVLLATLEGAVQPRCVLEIGTGTGGLVWALSHLSLVERIVTVDTTPAPIPAGQGFGLVEVRSVHGASQAPAVIDRVAELLHPYAADVVVIDGAHDYASVKADFDAYSGMTAEDGVIVLHDTRGYPGRTDFGVSLLLSQLQDMRPVTEIYSRRHGPAGTALVWASERWHGLTYNERETWPR